MEINEIVEKLKYYTEDLPKEALKEAIKHKEEITPKTKITRTVRIYKE